jgi:hypothetical protein
MPKYKIVSPIQHDGDVFVPGPDHNPQYLTAGKVGGKENLESLVAAGAVEVEVSAEDREEPPANYRDPDNRLGEGGAYVPAIDFPTPTNVPQAGPVDRMPIAAVAPQAAVFKRMAELANPDTSKQPTLAEQQEKRDEEQAAGAKAAQGVQQGGVSDPKKVAEQKGASPDTVKPGPEVPSPAMATGSPADVKEKGK